MTLFSKIRDFFRGGRIPAQLAAWIGVPEHELCEWLGGRPPEPRGREYAYTRFSIPKRRGGERMIEAPSELLKALQRRILHRLLDALPVHPAACGFVRRRSIVDNARPHVARGAVINLDLADFFPSITAERVYQIFRHRGWNRDAARILTNICTHEGHLPQGAPTSPALSNLVCYRLDTRLSKLLPKVSFGGHYTRYADDITLSFPRFGSSRLRRRKSGEQNDARPASRALLKAVRGIIESEGFRIQRKKRVRIQRPHQRQTATGLVLNRAVNLPRAVRRRVRAMQHRARLGQLDAKSTARLRGWEALLSMVARGRGESH